MDIYIYTIHVYCVYIYIDTLICLMFGNISMTTIKVDGNYINKGA